MTKRIQCWWVGLAIGLTSTSVAFADRMTAKDVVKVAPENGMPAVGAFKPTWCDGIGDDGTGGGFRGFVRHVESKHVWDNRVTAIRYSCMEPDNPAFQQQVGMYMQRWVNLTGATPKLLAAHFMLIAEGKVEALNTATCAKLPPIEEGSERLKYLRRAEADVLGCSAAGDPATPMHFRQASMPGPAELWHFDRRERVESQVLALARLLGCVGSDAPTPRDLVDWGACRLELAQVDAAKLDAELKAAGHNALAQIYAQEALATIKMRARAIEAAFQAARAKDPDIKTVLDAAETGWKQWVADYNANKAIVDAAIAYEDKYEGIRKSMGKNCFSSLAGLMKSIMAGKKGKTTEEVLTAATSGIGPVALHHLATCSEADLVAKYGRNLSMLMVEMIREWGPPARGPRIAAMVAMSKAAATIVADRTSFAYGPTDVSVRSPWQPFKRELPTVERQGEVATIKVDGDKVHVTFKTVKFKEQEMSCTETSKIIMWSGDGTPIYARNCKYTGRTVVRDATSEPFWTYRHFAGGIAKGTFVKVIGGGLIAGVPDEGYPVEVWSKNGKQLIAVMGLEAN